MKITKEELISELPLALTLMYLAYKVSRQGKGLKLDDRVLTSKDNSFFFNKYMH